MRTFAHQFDPSIPSHIGKTEVPGAGEGPYTGDTITSTMASYAGMKEIIADYVDGLPDEVRKMQELMESGELRQLQRVVHQLRGTGGGYGFDPISDQAAIAEGAIVAAESNESILLKVSALIDVLRRVEGFGHGK